MLSACITALLLYNIWYSSSIKEITLNKSSLFFLSTDKLRKIQF